MALPTPEDLTEASLVDFDALGFDSEPKLQRLLNVGLSLVKRYTDQTWAEGGVFAPVAPLGEGDEPLVMEAVLSLVEWLAFRKQEDVIETLGDFDLISSFSAGSYSESRRSGKDSQEANRAMLRGLLWPIMSPDKQDEWIQLETGVNAPSFEVTEVDWSGGSSMSSYDSDAAEPYPSFERWE